MPDGRRRPMRRHHAGPAAVAVAAMAVLSASAPLTSADPAQASSRPNLRRALLLETVPALLSSDDLAPSEAVARFGARTALSVDPSPAIAKPKRPPSKGTVGSSPPAGTPQAVLAAAYRKAVARAPRACHL